MIFKITPENKELLLQARTEIDGPFTEEKLVDVKKEVEKYATRDGYSAFIFIKEDQPVGYVEFKHYEPEAPPGSPPLPILATLGHVARIGVRKDCRRDKIGYRLLEVAENWLISAGLPGMWVGYLSENLGAGSLYAIFGFNDIPGVEFLDPRKNPPKLRRVAIKMWK